MPNIQVEASRQFKQYPGLEYVKGRVDNIVRKEIMLPFLAAVPRRWDEEGYWAYDAPPDSSSPVPALKFHPPDELYPIALSDCYLHQDSTSASHTHGKVNETHIAMSFY